MKQLVQAFYRRLDWSNFQNFAGWVIEEGIRLQQIPAPTFQEQARAAYVAARFREQQLQEVHIDAQHNVYGLLPGAQRSVPGLLVTAHTDTVFAADTPLTIRREGEQIYGPGLGDNSMGVAGLIGLVTFLREESIQPACDIWFVATTCEEGLGDLKGMRAACDALQKRFGAVINLEGLAYGHIYHAGIAVHRLHITAQADGGHSWLHFGRASAVHGIVALAAQICRLTPPASPRTTYNIGMVEGGHGINAIATDAGLWLDLRSEQQPELFKLRDRVLLLVKQQESTDLRFKVEVVGDRPAGYLSARHSLVQGALAALEQEGLRGSLETGSTDANVPLSAGIPAITVGITRGGNAHRLDEYIETRPVAEGMRQLITLTLAAARAQADQADTSAAD
ncbi:MAG: M20/M25/M40 family metallo-hydrolase [Anaerolineae bacterium]|jgi:acetylornithine deacetylase/succinyl-diaminopimelate desuccinylase-like protein|nr:M20/M25/M40 family metallo-hydrolase [Anaerolineae bacterium]